MIHRRCHTSNGRSLHRTQTVHDIDKDYAIKSYVIDV